MFIVVLRPTQVMDAHNCACLQQAVYVALYLVSVARERLKELQALDSGQLFCADKSVLMEKTDLRY